MSNESKKNFECQICKRELFATAQQFFNHYQYHCKNFQCDICQQTFQISAILDKHIKDAHNTQVMSHGDGSSYQCEFCDKTFGNIIGLKKHKKGVHSQNKPY